MATGKPRKEKRKRAGAGNSTSAARREAAVKGVAPPGGIRFPVAFTLSSIGLCAAIRALPSHLRSRWTTIRQGPGAGAERPEAFPTSPRLTGSSRTASLHSR